MQYYGYSNSPMACNDAIMVLVGGEECGVVALKPEDGSVFWRSLGTDISYAAPVLNNLDGQDQLVFFSPTHVIGMDPGNGAYLWQHRVINFCRTNCTSAIWGDDNLLWAATKGVGGTRVLKLTQAGGKTTVEEVWTNSKMKIHHWNAHRIGDHIYTSKGDSRKHLAVIDVNSGDIHRRSKAGLGAPTGSTQMGS